MKYQLNDVERNMKKFVITYAMTGGVTIDAETEEQAKEKFNDIPVFALYEDATPAVITEVYEEIDE